MKNKLLNSFAFGLIFFLGIACGASGKNSQKSITSVVVPNEFVSTWRVGDASFGDGDLTVTLPLRSGFNYNFTVDWGDGTTAEVTAHDDVDIDHAYGSAGDYTIKITGTVEAWYFNNTGDKDKIISVQELGSVGWKNFDNAFSGCSNLTTFSGGDTSNVTDMGGMFAFAASAQPNTSGWNTSNVTDMGGMFIFAASAQPDTSGWDTSNVTTMLSMFNGATAANPNTSGWNTSNVTSMQAMFSNASSAIPDTSKWDTSSVTSMAKMFFFASSANPDTSKWNITNVTDMSDMFNGAGQAVPDTSNWNTSNVTDMNRMFRGAVSAAPDVSGWNTSNVTDMNYMFSNMGNISIDFSGWDFSSAVNDFTHFLINSSLLTQDYDTLLIRLDTTATLAQDLTAGSTTYTNGGAGATARSSLTGKGWNISDFGPI
ncbi:MAG: BspA family leucine-rich repeat surface protein [Halobacteriovoraceae bacterium]|nr:BspA family leucine-rich repeat surface protein [Halobacteriovoraceae bacterium]|tara:strand:- start:1352 stop:2632 length:1281 start_codon:yes stop_codon:yes gene_type:complete